MTQTHWHIRTVEETLEDLRSTKQGITTKQAENRRDTYGENKLPDKHGINPFKLLLSKLNSPLIYILFVASAISFFADKTIEAVVILVIITFTTALSFIQEYHANNVMQELADLTPTKVKVKRDNSEELLDAKELVPGDIIHIERGDIIPADARIITANGFSVDESILTGETTAVRKKPVPVQDEHAALHDQHNIVFSGTKATHGSAVAIVIRTGSLTELGSIAENLETTYTKSPLQQRIDAMSITLGAVVLAVCILIFTIQMQRGVPIPEILLLIGAVAVSGIPESFPLALTFGLSRGVKRMSTHNAVIRELSAVETLGTTTTICTDKTGTLTTNKMVPAAFHFPGQPTYTVEGHGYEPNHVITHHDEPTDTYKDHNEFFYALALCNDADLVFDGEQWGVDGEPTEGALLTLAESADYQVETIRENNKSVHVVPFDPENKYMVTVNNPENPVAYLKGAAEIVLEKCTHIAENRDTRRISETDKRRIKDLIQRFAAEGLRVLGVATKPVEKTDFEEHDTELRTNYVFRGVVALKDPIRRDAKQAVKECQDAGVHVIMITGDHKTTAKSIAEDINIVNDEYTNVLEGHEIDRYDDKDLQRVLQGTAVICRATPAHKHRVVTNLQRLGEIVAMTGDGVNDAPALSKADIGVSMGKTGTEVARQASDMVLLDDSFSTIVDAVREGRTIFSNIRRFMYYLLTGNFTEILLVLLAVIFDLVPPLTPLMILFINLITSTFPALALSVEPTHEKVMHQKPRRKNEALLNGYVALKIGVLIPILLLGTFAVYLVTLRDATLITAQTAAFATLIVFELFHTFNARRLHTTIFDEGFFSNKAVFASIAVSTALMLLAVHTTIGNQVFSTTSLQLETWVFIVLVSTLVIFFNEGIKLLIKSEFQEQRSRRGTPMLE